VSTTSVNSKPTENSNTPRAMLALPRDRDGAPIPWGVKLIDAVPDYSGFDENKFNRALSAGRCWTCGERLAPPGSSPRAFLVTPAEAIMRMLPEPPSHPSCISFLARRPPRNSRTSQYRLLGVWMTRKATPAAINKGPERRTVFWLDEPTELYWLADGRAASREDVEAEIAAAATQMPELAAESGLTTKQLAEQLHQLRRWLP